MAWCDGPAPASVWHRPIITYEVNACIKMAEDTKRRIQRLSPEVTRYIAAGEVVERPASVVKELIENALDAGATVVEVEIRDGGLSWIRVADNGAGIEREDVPLAFERFATSKIRRIEDLTRLRTLGFRGEALPAIAAVATVELLTRPESAVEGTRAVIGPDQPLTLSPAAAPVGTQVLVRDLFAHMPARRKFLKSPLREAELVQQIVVRYSLAFPEVTFRLVVNGRSVLALPGTSPLQRIGQVLGRDVAEHMVEIQWEAVDLQVHGWISSPQVSRATRQTQFFTVNRRPVRSGLLAVMLERPYAGRLPPGRKPIAVVDIAVDPRWVDVNVHPRKWEVRFAQERSVYWALAQAVEQALAPFPALSLGDASERAWHASGATTVPITYVAEPRSPYRGTTPRVLGQFRRRYILVEDEQGLLLIDQHAAHEQVLFERVQAFVSEVHVLSPPVVVHVTPREAEQLSELVSHLAGLGMELEPFGAHAFAVRSVPQPIAEALPTLHQVEVCQALLEALVDEAQRHPRVSPEMLSERLAARMACFAAVKAGDPLTPEQQEALVRALWETWSPATCPHGRPAYIVLSESELERRFQRG